MINYQSSDGTHCMAAERRTKKFNRLVRCYMIQTYKRPENVHFLNIIAIK